jgi:hypothetical protein
MKSVEIYYGRKIFLEDWFVKSDTNIHKFSLKVKYWWSHVNFKNTQLVFSWLAQSSRRLVIGFKRRFDHKQSHFFTKREPDTLKQKGSVSFFLKNVSDYKKSLRENRENGI